MKPVHKSGEIHFSDGFLA